MTSAPGCTTCRLSPRDHDPPAEWLAPEMSDSLRIAPQRGLPRGLDIAGEELDERFSRSSGPGGQGVNTTDSRVELSFDVARSPAVPEWLRPRMLRRLGGR